MCETRSVPASNPNRFPVVFSIRITISGPPPTTTGTRVLCDPIIASLTYFRHEVPVMLLFNAYGFTDLNDICRLIHRTCRWADQAQLRHLLYPTIQHSAAVRSKADALSVLCKCMQLHATSSHGHTTATPRPAVPVTEEGAMTAAEELLTQSTACIAGSGLFAMPIYCLIWCNPGRRWNIWPTWLAFYSITCFGPKHGRAKCTTRITWATRGSTCVAPCCHSRYAMPCIGCEGLSLAGDTDRCLKNPGRYYRAPERNLAKAMTCRSQLAQAIRDLPNNTPRSMASIQSSIVSYFEAHQISKFIAYAMSTGNWSMNSHPGHASGNSMATAVAIKTGVIQQLTSMNQLAIQSHIRRVCTPLDRVGRGSRPRRSESNLTIVM